MVNKRVRPWRINGMSLSSKQETQSELTGKNKALLVAVTDGSMIPIEEVPDLVFSEKMIIHICNKFAYISVSMFIIRYFC